MEIQDRLPFEVLHRLHGDEGPPFHQHHEPRGAQLVISSKKSGTFRPFSRLEPVDLILYQALVDQLVGTVEGALPPREQAGAYRQAGDGGDDAFAGTPTNDEFLAGISSAIINAGDIYVLQTDVSGYFLGVRPALLKDDLLEAGAPADVVEDLADLLHAWERLGVRGLPQGVRPSSVLGNFYLAPLDRDMGAAESSFFRWVDDMWVLCATFGEARRMQDRIERHLYAKGLTLNGEKTRILRASTAMKRLEPAKERFDQKRDEAVEELMMETVRTGYEETEHVPDPEEVDHDLTLRELERLTTALAEEDLPPQFHADMGLVLRNLESVEDTAALESAPGVLRRAPDLADRVLQYVGSVAKLDEDGALAVFAAVLDEDYFSREFERLSACHRALSLKPKEGSPLADSFARLALNDDHELVRAKALVAWGRHSSSGDIDVAERFLETAAPRWRAYAFVAVQDKDEGQRSRLYERWQAPGELSDLAALVTADKMKWTKL